MTTSQERQSGVRERPILFSGPMVRALIEGRKTMTRRVFAPRSGWKIVADPVHDGTFEWWTVDRGDGVIVKPSRDVLLGECPYGQPGDRLWVRETWGGAFVSSARVCVEGPDVDPVYPRGWKIPKERPANFSLMYRADMKSGDEGDGWFPSIHMPRWASRLTLEITEVRVERLQEISREDVDSEGLTPGWDWQGAFRSPWDGLNAKRDGGAYSWERNPWVWVIAFRRIP